MNTSLELASSAASSPAHVCLLCHLVQLASSCLSCLLHHTPKERVRLLQELIWPVKLLYLTLVHHLQRDRGREENMNVNKYIVYMLAAVRSFPRVALLDLLLTSYNYITKIIDKSLI